MSDLSPVLPDPRQYPESSPSNMLIHYAQSIATARSEDDRAMWQDSLRAALSEMLEREELLSLSVALAMVTSQQTYQILWDALRDAAECPDAGRHAVVFAVPVVLVVGSKNKVTLPERIADVDGLNGLFRQHGLFAQGAEVFLSGKLLHPDSIVDISSAQIYRYTRQLADAARGLPLELPAAAITAKDEGVFLRYLLGVAIQEEGAPAPVKLGGSVGAWGVPLMKFLGDQLKTDGVTLFPIPRPPMPLMQAIAAANHARLEVALQVFASSQIRLLRDQGQEPVAVVSAHDNGELHFTVSAAGNEKDWGGFVWPLAAQDVVGQIETSFRILMAECQVSDVRLVPDVQPESRDGIPLFFTADDWPVSQTLQ
ncbi:hypothetical protein PQU95_04740 [Vogesella sp. DC21W]|uniref:Uncharacterized protein n=1 Tax=Vogesella aquatica TaxID=2984206 RepID=A0ABT5IY33_9NEIS|nr:hypothetical protein [Vogesella aquatica]MDC7716524.1 hypothetical protein [Vogesella aquatica]